MMHHNYIAILLKEPKSQLTFNMFFTWFWIANMIGMATIYIGFNEFYTAHQPFFVLYLIEISLWANVATHFGAISASEAAVQTEIHIEAGL